MNGQVEISNGEVKNILKKIIQPNAKDWVHKIPDALWAYWMMYKTPIKMSRFRLIFGEACHLLVKLENRAYQKAQPISKSSYWAIKKLNLSLDEAWKQ